MNEEMTVFFETFDYMRLFYAFGIILVFFGLAQLVQWVNTSSQKRFPEFRLRIEQVSTVGKFLLLLCGGAISVLALFGFSKEVIVTVAGSLAVAVGFGLKDIAASILSGFMILFERPFQVGDRIKFADTYGDVTGIGLRSTQVRTLDDSMVTIPNSRFLTDTVSSANAGHLDMMAQIDFYIHFDSDLSLVRKLSRESVIASRYVYLEKPVTILFSDEFIEQHYCTRLRIKAYIVDTRYEKPFHTDLTARLHKAFERNQIKRPLRYETQSKS